VPALQGAAAALKQKCACGQARPVRKGAQKALEDPYEVWEERFGAECGICGRVASDRRRLDRDHCHKTGAARGLCAPMQSVAAVVDDFGVAARGGLVLGAR
jgi:hypothetical protein